MYLSHPCDILIPAKIDVWKLLGSVFTLKHFPLQQFQQEASEELIDFSSWFSSWMHLFIYLFYIEALKSCSCMVVVLFLCSACVQSVAFRELSVDWRVLYFELAASARSFSSLSSSQTGCTQRSFLYGLYRFHRSLSVRQPALSFLSCFH